MASKRHRRRVGDTLTPLARQLKQIGTNGQLENVNLTGCTVKFSLCDPSGTKIVNETETGVTVVDAANGKVQYTFQAADVANAGEYRGYFHVYSGSNRDTFPEPEQDLIIEIGAID